jgi:hypothetical protein
VIEPHRALVVPAAPPGLAPLSACGRTQRVFDGLTRYNIELFPSRVETIAVAQKPIESMVCRARMRAVQATGAQRWPDALPAYRALVWLAPLADARWLLPLRVETDWSWGRLLLETTDVAPFEAARAAALR